MFLTIFITIGSKMADCQPFCFLFLCNILDMLSQFSLKFGSYIIHVRIHVPDYLFHNQIKDGRQATIFSPRSDEVRNGDLWIGLRPCVRASVRPRLYLRCPWTDSFQTLYIPSTFWWTYARAMISWLDQRWPPGGHFDCENACLELFLGHAWSNSLQTS